MAGSDAGVVAEGVVPPAGGGAGGAHLIAHRVIADRGVEHRGAPGRTDVTGGTPVRTSRAPNVLRMGGDVKMKYSAMCEKLACLGKA